MLFSMSNDGTGNMQVQISNLVAHVNKLREKELELKNEKIVFQAADHGYVSSSCYYGKAAHRYGIWYSVVIPAFRDDV